MNKEMLKEEVLKLGRERSSLIAEQDALRRSLRRVDKLIEQSTAQIDQKNATLALKPYPGEWKDKSNQQGEYRCGDCKELFKASENQPSNTPYGLTCERCCDLIVMSRQHCRDMESV